MSRTPQRSSSMMSNRQGLADSRPVLHLSGTKLRIALERLIHAAEPLGGIERFAEAVRLKSVVFQDRLADGKAAAITRGTFEEIVPLMATVRRRIGPLLEVEAWPDAQRAIAALIDGAHDTTIADARIAAFESALRPSLTAPLAGEPKGRTADGDQQDRSSRSGARPRDRFLRDLAAELLHNTLPENYPLMQRWVWDGRANTGALRQLWHDPNGGGDDVDHVVIDVADGYETHLVLREELSQFLADNGVFRDMLWHVDLVCAQVYGDYISAQGGAYLKADFVSEGDPLEHTRRILGLDRVAGKRRLPTIEGATDVPPPIRYLT